MKDLSINRFNDVAKEHLNESTLYFDSYPKALAKFIKNCQPPITIALQGEWGSGKTSMMNMVKEELADSKVELMDFNAWLFSQFNLGDQLPLILLTHLSQEAGFDNKVKDVLAKFAVSAVHFIGKKYGGTDNFMSTFTPDDIEQLKNLRKSFESAVKKKLDQSGNEKLLIFIDDIDRVEPEKAVELLESIKLFCECPNCIFVLAVDYDVILKGAKKKFGDDKGQAFFDKIIQVPFNMPITTSKIDKFMESLLEEVFSGITDTKKKEELRDFYIGISKLTIGNNPRSIKRLLNSFVITDYVANAQQVYNNNKTDDYVRVLLYSLLCLENYNSIAYEYIIEQVKGDNEDQDGESSDSGIANLRDKLDSITKNETEVKKEFEEFIELSSEDDFDIDIFSKFLEILDRIKSFDDKNIDFKKVFSISSSAISKESKEQKKIPEDLMNFNNICNENLVTIRDNLNKKYNNIKFILRKSKSFHKPLIFYKDKNSETEVGFCCVYDKNNPNSVSILIQYWKKEMQDSAKELYERISSLNLSGSKKSTTTGTQFFNVLSFDINNFNELEKYINDNLHTILEVFN